MNDIDLGDLIAAAGRLQTRWDSEGLQFCFIGGLAVHHWGQPRQTSDVDVTVWTEFGNERPTIDRLLETLTARIDDAALFAMENRVLLGRDAQGVDIDVLLAAFPFELDLIDRSRLQTCRKTPLRLCGPSDLVILKAFANRPHDWEDIRGVLVRSEALLDWELIDREIEILATLKEEPEIIGRLKELRR